MSELMTKDNGGWTPLMFAYRSGSRRVFFVAMQAFMDRGDAGTRTVRIEKIRGVYNKRRRLAKGKKGVEGVLVHAVIGRGD